MMTENTCLLYNDIIEVYNNLIVFCTTNGFKVKDSKEEFYFLRAKKSSILFWKTMRLELSIEAVDKKQVMVSAMVYKFGLRNSKLESKFIIAIENYFKNDNVK